jgi:hypothetical protein
MVTMFYYVALVCLRAFGYICMYLRLMVDRYYRECYRNRSSSRLKSLTYVLVATTIRATLGTRTSQIRSNVYERLSVSILLTDSMMCLVSLGNLPPSCAVSSRTLELRSCILMMVTTPILSNAMIAASTTVLSESMLTM